MIGMSLPGRPLDVLCLGAHPDDIEIGCGGALLRLARREGLRLSGVVLTGTERRTDEARAAIDRFVPGAKLETFGLPDGRLPAYWNDTKEALEDVASRVQPDLVFAPRVDDAHQDHRLVGRLATTVWRNALVLHYEIPKWDGDMGAPSHYIGLTREQARRKVDVLNRHFPSQHAHDWWDDEVFLGLMRLRGMECRQPYAEAFYVAKALLEV
jgi:LmbE family N-acetylglucosaminyl deacetylase